MKNPIEVLNALETKIELSYLYENNITFEELEERVEAYIFEQEIIYYSQAIAYLKEEDSSLNESLQLAIEYGFTLDNLNSETLATLLYQSKLQEEWHSIKDSLEDYINSINN